VVNNLFVRLAEEWDGFTVHPGTYHDAGDVVVAEVRYTGTYKATGKSMDTQDRQGREGCEVPAVR